MSPQGELSGHGLKARFHQRGRDLHRPCGIFDDGAGFLEKRSGSRVFDEDSDLG
jgi:hypothetical protein